MKATKLFELFATLKLDASEFETSVDKAIKQSEGLGDAVGQASKENKSFSGEVSKGVFAGSMIADWAKDAGRALMDFASESVQTASDLEEVQNVVDVTFRNNTSKVNTWAKNAKSSYGMSELSAKKYSSTMGAMLKSMGLTTKEATSMALSVTGLAGDMASFYNLDHDTAFDKIRAGLAGETEPLKQLGINMSVANLEAFAMSRGIDKSFQSMSQAEQATLRYNYLLSTTAAAQGDFERTRSSYSNSVRALGQNMESVKADVGQWIIEVVNPFIAGLNDLFTTDPASLLDQFGQIDSEYQGTLESITKTTEKTDSLFAILTSLEGKTEGNTQAGIKWNETLRELVATVPELSQYINLQTGEVEGGVKALREHTSAVLADSRAQAKAAALRDKQEAVYNTQIKLAQSEIDLQVATDQWGRDFNAVMESAGKAADDLDVTFDGTIDGANGARAVLAKYDQERAKNGQGNVGLLKDYLNVYGDTEQSLRDTMAAFDETNASVIQGRETVSDYTAQVAAAQTELETYDAALSGAGTSTEDAAEAQERYNSALTGEVEAYNSAMDAAQKLMDYRAGVLEAIRSQIDKVASTWEGIETPEATDAETLEKNLKSQQTYFDTYKENFQWAVQHGLAPELAAQMSDASEENAAALQGMRDAGSSSIEDINAQWTALQSSKDELTQALGAASLLADDEYQKMLSTTEEFVVALNQADEARANAYATGEGIAGGLQAALPDVQAEISKYNALMASIGSAKRFNISAEGSAPSGPQYYKAHAVGLDYVPYDNYPALLHEGEGVLTKSENAAKSRGEGGSGGVEIDYDRLGNVIAAALSGMAVQMDGKAVGNIVTETVSRNIAQQVRWTK